MTIGVDRFKAQAPALLEAAQSGADPSQLLAAARQALAGLQSYDLPIGWKHVPDPLFPATAWVGVVAVELKSPNWFMSDFRYRSGLRKKWGGALRGLVSRIEKVASWEGMQQLGRAPRCYDRMRIQLIRLTPSVRNFLRDDDNSAFCSKQAADALQDVGLIKSDRREWFTSAPLLQDVSPITAQQRDKQGRMADLPVHATLLILWPSPTAAGLLTGVPHADRREHAAPYREMPTHDGGTEKGRTVSRVRRRPHTRAVDV